MGRDIPERRGVHILEQGIQMNIDTAKRIVDTTPILRDIERVEYLDEGFSTDEKYVLWKGGVPMYLLRLSGNRADVQSSSMGHAPRRLHGQRAS